MAVIDVLVWIAFFISIVISSFVFGMMYGMSDEHSFRAFLKHLFCSQRRG